MWRATYLAANSSSVSPEVFLSFSHFSRSAELTGRGYRVCEGAGNQIFRVVANLCATGLKI